MCAHDAGFFLMATYEANGLPPYVFACNRQCGFWLNFDPKMAGKHRSVKWKKFIISYTCEPVQTKELPTLQPSRY